MNDSHGGDSDRVAPIIPLFGGTSKKADPAPMNPGAESDRPSGMPPQRTGDASEWRSTWGNSSGVPSVDEVRDGGVPRERHPAGAARASADSEKPHSVKSAPHLRALGGRQAPQNDQEDTPTADEIRVAAEESLVRKLRSRSLSLSEARQVLRGHQLEGGVIDEVIDDFCRRGYLDDVALAGVLVTSGVERKGQGRVALSRALVQRGISRDVIDGALDELPDDDDDRALEFARSKARSMSRLDHDTALRRLVGQLSRRGYNGSVAMKAAKTALRETASGGFTSGVRFVESD